MLNVAVAFWDY